MYQLRTDLRNDKRTIVMELLDQIYMRGHHSAVVIPLKLRLKALLYRIAVI